MAVELGARRHLRQFLSRVELLSVATRQIFFVLSVGTQVLESIMESWLAMDVLGFSKEVSDVD